MSVTMEVKGIKEIKNMFNEFPKKVNKDSIWGRFWKQSTTKLVETAKGNAPLLKPNKYNRTGIPYPPDKSKTISRGTLRDSLEFYRTKASKGKIHGAYVGPRVKGKFSKNRGGYFGAWVEYGNEVMHFGKYKSKGNPFMQKTWKQEKNSVLRDGFKRAEKLFKAAMKAFERRMNKYGSFGY
tara:strand:- start:223 stop:765 length:543 start_codon:yes stop_codon:yes gene_type:complete